MCVCVCVCEWAGQGSAWRQPYVCNGHSDPKVFAVDGIILHDNTTRHSAYQTCRNSTGPPAPAPPPFLALSPPHTYLPLFQEKQVTAHPIGDRSARILEPQKAMAVAAEAPALERAVPCAVVAVVQHLQVAEGGGAGRGRRRRVECDQDGQCCHHHGEQQHAETSTPTHVLRLRLTQGQWGTEISDNEEDRAARAEDRRKLRH